jgi:osmotically-inducible protein OsmY
MMFGNKRKSRLEQARIGASEVIHGVGDTLHEVIDHAPEKFDGIKHSASDALHAAVSTLGARADSLREVAESLRDKADALRGQAMEQGTHYAAQYADAARAKASVAQQSARAATEGALKSAQKMKKQRAKQAHDLAEEARHFLHDKQEAAAARVPKVSVQSSNDKWLWLLFGIGIGALIGVLLAPNKGRRTRAALKDKLAGGASDLGEAAARKVQHISERASGAVHDLKARGAGEGEDAGDDVTIADRVRSAIGHLEKDHGWNIARINIDSSDGVVTLRGPVADSAVADELVAVAEKVLGVREVHNELAVEQEDEAFVG